MKKWILTAAAVLLLYSDLVPFESMDAGELCVVETLLVECEGTQVRVLSEEAVGDGENIAEAVERMEENAPGRLFLRQVQRVIFCNGAEKQVALMDIPQEIPLGAGVYQTDGSGEGLLDDLEGLENRLRIMEQEKNRVPTLAYLKNEELQRE